MSIPGEELHNRLIDIVDILTKFRDLDRSQDTEGGDESVVSGNPTAELGIVDIGSLRSLHREWA